MRILHVKSDFRLKMLTRFDVKLYKSNKTNETENLPRLINIYQESYVTLFKYKIQYNIPKL